MTKPVREPTRFAASDADLMAGDPARTDPPISGLRAFQLALSGRSPAGFSRRTGRVAGAAL